MEPVLWPEELDDGPVRRRRKSWWRRLLDRLTATEGLPGNY
jgi:hypothetical protein